MGGRGSFTLDAAERLIRTRLRQHLLRKLADRGVDTPDPTDLVFDVEKSIEASAEAAWHQILRLWPYRNTNALEREQLKSYVQQALDRSLQRSGAFIAIKQASVRNEDLAAWAREFARSFSPESLIDPKSV